MKTSYDIKQTIIEAGKQMRSSGLTIETWGNISCRDKETGLIYLTPSGMAYDTLTPDDIVVCDKDGHIVEGKRVPTVEKDLHLMLYENRDDIHAILHTHPIDSMVFAVLHKPIPVISDEMAQSIGAAVECAEYALPGSKELAVNCLKAIGHSQACLLANHGAVIAGRTLKECFKTAAVLETSAAVYYKALAIGTPVIENDDDVAWMRDFALNKYGKENNK